MTDHTDAVRDQIEDIFLARLDMGNVKFGPWKTPYERKHIKECLGESLDLSIYISRMLVQWDATMDLLDEVAHKAKAREALGENKERAVAIELAARWDKIVEAITNAI